MKNIIEMGKGIREIMDKMFILSPEQIRKQYEAVVADPNKYIEKLGNSNILFAAGGNLPQVFGEANLIWEALTEKSQEGKITIAGVEFTIDELADMGDFYRWAHAKGFYFHCIDERLQESEDYTKAATHEHCGACAAVTATAGLPQNVEEILIDVLGSESFAGNQKIDPDMTKAHRSLVLLIDLNGAGDAINSEWRQRMKPTGCLPFNISIPLNLISEWSKGQESKQTSLISTMVRWNAQIARNIIGGAHNELNDKASETLMIVDKRSTDTDETLTYVEGELEKVVSKSHRLEIQDSK